MSYLEQSKSHYEQSQGDVTKNYNKALKEWATIEALIAIAEELKLLNAKLEAWTSYSGSSIRTTV